MLDDDEDLNSLDDGLHAFQEPSVYQNSRRVDQSGDTILPAHDGLGSFPASSAPVQEQIWQFEQYNPLKRSASHHRRRSSVQRRLNAVEDSNEAQLERERTERIEQWRMEQSKVLLDEIEKETRRRKMSRTRDMTASIASMAEEEKATTGGENDVSRFSTRAAPGKPEESESFWQRITRRVIRDLMGIDENLLSVIFGEALPDGGGPPPESSIPLATAEAKSPEASSALALGNSWEDRLLDRLARELGILVHQLSEHPGAFSSYLNSSTIDYAGIPVTRPYTPRPPAESAITKETENVTSMLEPDFPPTIQGRRTSASTPAGLWGFEEEETPPASSSSSSSSALDPDYWERSPDIKTLFRFLHQRFLSHRRAASTPAPKPPTLATAHTPDSLRRAALIRQHHPLVAPRAPAASCRSSALLHHHHSSPLLPSAAPFRRSGSSCASRSTRMRERAAPGSGSSRNYWDLGGSVGSGSAVDAGGGLGAWGEV